MHEEDRGITYYMLRPSDGAHLRNGLQQTDRDINTNVKLVQIKSVP
jgi:hypothetical protein